jgi:hypothetical protein
MIAKGVRREAGRKSVQIRCDEGVASRIGPESCIAGREVRDAASARERTGRPLGRGRNIPGVAAGPIAEDNMDGRAVASVRATRRGQTSWHGADAFARAPAAGGFSRGVLHPAVALQRLPDRRSARRDDGRRPRAVDRRGTAGMDGVGLCDCRLHRRLRHRQHHRNRADADTNQDISQERA